MRGTEEDLPFEWRCAMLANHFIWLGVIALSAGIFFAALIKAGHIPPR